MTHGKFGTSKDFVRAKVISLAGKIRTSGIMAASVGVATVTVVVPVSILKFTKCSNCLVSIKGLIIPKKAYNTVKNTRLSIYA